MSIPSFIVIAGPNGAGKSTLTQSRLPFFSELPVLDPDAVANTIQFASGHASPLSAGREVLERIAIEMENHQSLAVETTLSGKHYLRTMARARLWGYRVILVYVGTESVEINLVRIANRVKVGGHNVPEADVRRRYLRSFHNLPLAIRLADAVILFDNSNDEGYQLVAAGEKGKIEWIEPLPEWALRVKTQLS